MEQMWERRDLKIMKKNKIRATFYTDFTNIFIGFKCVKDMDRSAFSVFTDFQTLQDRFGFSSEGFCSSVWS